MGALGPAGGGTGRRDSGLALRSGPVIYGAEGLVWMVRALFSNSKWTSHSGASGTGQGSEGALLGQPGAQGFCVRV